MNGAGVSAAVCALLRRLLGLPGLPPAARLRLVSAPPGQYPRALWQVWMPRSSSVYMVAYTTSGFVVHVDAANLYRAWRASAEREGLPHPVSRRQMRRDRKFHLAVESFLAGAGSPVPLAYVTARVDCSGRTAVSFVDGVTRTYWLLANGAASFPVWTPTREEAGLLHQVAGLGDGPIPVADLYLDGPGAKADRADCLSQPRTSIRSHQ